MKKISAFGWLDFLLGLVLVGFGVYTFFSPQAALSGVIIIYSILAIVMGILDIMFYFRLKSNIGLGPTVSLVTGIISILAGFMLMLNPVLGTWLFGVGFAIWFIAHSISRLANYKRIRFLAGKWAAVVSMVFNIVGILLGVVLLFNPVLSTLSLGYLVGIALVVYGAGCIIEAFSKLGKKEDPPQRDYYWE